MNTRRYRETFFDRADRSLTAARVIVPIVREALVIGSVLDVGCARGAWLSVWAEAGCEIGGIDSSLVDKSRLQIDPRCFSVHDLSTPFDLGRRFDLVQCVEVAEHLPSDRCETLVADLTRHADAVLFSAAPPGQGGVNHVNERPYRFWQALFLDRDYVPLDYIRPRIISDGSIPYWYRYNLLLYVAQEKLAVLPGESRTSLVAEVKDMAPPLFRFRKRILRSLPTPLVNLLAVMVGN
jgi:hypothetical protein